MPAIAEAPPPVSNDQRIADEALNMAFNEIDPRTTPPKIEEAPKPEPKQEAPELFPDPKKEETPESEAKKEEPKPDPVKNEEVDPLLAPPEGVVPPPKPTNADLRSQLKARNEAVKKLEDEKAAWEEEKKTWQAEKETLEKKLSEQPAAEVDSAPVNYAADPSVQRVWNPVMEALDVLSDKLGAKEGKALQGNFQSLLMEYSNATAKRGTPEGDAAIQALHERIETEIGEDSRRDVMSFLAIQALPGYKQAMSEIDRLKGDSHNRKTRQNLDRYMNNEKEFDAVLAPLGEVPESVVAAQPYAVESWVSKLIKSDPKWGIHSAKVKKEIKEVMAGLKPLSPEEQAALAANDAGGLSTTEEKRTKEFKTRQANMVKRAYLGTIVLTMFPRIIEELETLRAGKEEEDSETDAIEKVPATKPSAANGAPPPVRDFGKDVQDIFAGRELPV